MAELTRTAAEELLFRESRLLDDGELKRWLELFTDDCEYWIPTWNTTPDEAPSVIYDDRGRLEERIFRLIDTPAYSQLPASRTVHLVSNVEVDDGDGQAEDGDGTTTIRCSAAIAEMRPGDRTQVGLGRPRVHYARMTYDVVHDDGHWLIRRKRIDLLDRDQPLYNLTFLL